MVEIFRKVVTDESMTTMQTKNITVFQLRAARSGLGLTISELNKLTGLSRSTITSIEKQNAGTPPKCDLMTVYKLREYFESKGIIFEESNQLKLNCNKSWFI